MTKNQNNKTKAMTKTLITMLSSLILLSSCSTYRSSWECPKARGIGCSSLEYADEMARELIMLNTGQNRKSKNKNKKVLLNQDLLGNKEYEVTEIE